MQLKAVFFSLYIPDGAENLLRSQQLLIGTVGREHLVLTLLYCLMSLSQYWSEFASSSDSVSMISCVMIFIAAAVGDNV